jgi:hypothetical protein
VSSSSPLSSAGFLPTSMTDPSPIAGPSSARLTSSALITALRPLYPLPRKNQPASSRPTVASLHAFLVQIPQAQQAIPSATEQEAASPDGAKDASQRRFAGELGLVALWAVEQLDESVRDESSKLPKDGQSASPTETSRR